MKGKFLLLGYVFFGQLLMTQEKFPSLISVENNEPIAPGMFEPTWQSLQ